MKTRAIISIVEQINENTVAIHLKTEIGKEYINQT